MKHIQLSHSALLLFTLVPFLSLKSQTITYENPAEFFLCEDATFSITVSNDSPGDLQNATLSISFTTNQGSTCGVSYVLNSIVNASEQDISNPGNPVFSLGNIASGNQANISFKAEAPCEVIGCIDNAELFINEITLQWDGGQTSLTTDPYVIERPLLVLTQQSGTILKGSQGDKLIRTFTIQNTRPGRLGSFTFTDAFQAGIDISSPLGPDEANPADTFQLTLGPSHFMNIGDGDEWFEFNEVIVITEEIMITGCGLEEKSSASNISFSWSCLDEEVCQSELTTAVVLIDLSTKIPVLQYTPKVNVPECFCGPDGIPQSLTITNSGEATALNIEVNISQLLGVINGFIDTTSIAVDSAGQEISFAINAQSIAIPPALCGTPMPVFNNVTVGIQQLEPGELITIRWNNYYCSSSCNQPKTGWRYQVKYEKPCPEGSIVNTASFAAQNSKPLLESSISQSPSVYNNDSTYTVDYTLNYDSLSLLDDELVLNITLAPGVVWDFDNDLAFDGIEPTEIIVNQSGPTTAITAHYQLPFPDNSATTQFHFTFDCSLIEDILPPCKDSIETSCPVPVCVVPGLSLTNQISAAILKCPGNPDGCNIQNCVFFGAVVDCPIDSLCITNIPGYLRYGLETFRKNLGLPDNDNNQVADGSGSIDLSLIRRDRLLPGDTLFAALKGEVIIDDPDIPLKFISGSFDFFGGGEMSSLNRAVLFEPDKLPFSSGRIRIYDKSQNTWYDCNAPLPLIDDSDPGEIIYTFVTSTNALIPCGLPATFVFENGDSVIFETEYVIKYNPKREGDPDPLMGTIYIQPEFRIFEDTLASSAASVDCENCTPTRLELSYYEYSIQPGIFSLPPCSTSEYSGGNLFKLELAGPNFFPYEFRSLAKALNWQVTLETGIEIAEAKLTFLRLQTGTSIAEEVILTPTLQGSTYIFDLSQFQEPVLEEGFFGLFQYRFNADCDLKGAKKGTYGITLDFDPLLPEQEDPLLFFVSSNNLRMLVPNLNLSTPLTNLTIFDNQLSLDFELANFSTTVGSQVSGAAPNTWLYFLSPSGKLVDVKIINLESGDTLVPQNGLYLLGNFPKDTIPFRLLATNTSCEQEAFELHYGWNCDPFTSILQTSCSHQILPFTVQSPPGEIDFFVHSPQGCFDLCDTVPAYSLEIFNAELGAVYDLELSAFLPPGLDILPGSSQVEYPTGSGNFYPIGEPQNIASGVYQYGLAALFDSLAHGLPGVTTFPANSITVSFQTKTSCETVALARPYFIIAAQQNCNVPTNSVAKPGEPLCINGVAQPYTANITAQPGGQPGCEDQLSYDVSITASTALPAGACLIVTLPEGITYEAGSCSSACQSNFDCTPVYDNGNYTWTLPQGVPAGELICLSFNTLGWASLPCEEGIVVFRTAVETQALCAETGDSCSVKVNTGEVVLNYEPQRPAFELSNFTIEAASAGANDVVNYSIDITNNGAPSNDSVILDLYLDSDGNGSGDQLVHTKTYPQSLGNGETVTLTGQLTLPAGLLCQFLAVIDPDDQCACAGDIISATAPIIYETNQDTTVCSGQLATIGLPAQPGYNYLWVPADCLSGTGQSTTTFNCVNEEPLPVVYEFVLQQTYFTGCQINNLLDVTVNPVPGIAFADSPVCLGESANLVATEGASYNWEGPGIVNPNLQVQTVSPSANAVYSVTVVDAIGCTGTESVEVLVNPLPEANAGPDQTLCAGDPAQLMASSQPGLLYSWSPATANGQPLLSNPNTFNPFVLQNIDTTFVLTVTDPATGCKASDAASVVFLDSLVVTVSPDITICAGGSATLQASGAEFYSWSPAATCLNSECSSVMVAPASTTTYTVTGTDTSGCAAQAFVTVFVTTETIVTQGPDVELCEGESTVIFGEVVDSPGTYCDTTQLSSGCDSVHCINVLLKPGIDTTLTLDTICEGGNVIFENMSISDEGLHCVTYPGQNGCDSTVCLNLTVIDTPFFEFLVPDTFILGNVLELSIQPGAFDSILWFGGNITGLCTNSPVCTDSLTEGGEYLYQVTAWNSDGCQGSASQTVVAIPECNPEKADVPNVFTPNGDQVNDTFSIVSQGSELVQEMKIWNRFGQLVYEGRGPWDGKQKGEPAESDVYVYLIKVGCPVSVPADEKVLKGDVTLLR
ncbi:MAG: hypothetical protein Kow0027_11880 [Saprospiraceae bacterium]